MIPDAAERRMPGGLHLHALVRDALLVGPAVLNSLRVRLLLLVLVAVVPMLTISVLWARAHERLIAREASDDAQALAQLVGERHQRFVDGARGLLLAMSRMRSVAALDGAACSASLGPLLGREPIFVNMGAATPDGTLFCSAATPPGPINVADRAFFREALRSGGLGVGEQVISRARGKGALGFGFPVVVEGKVVAVALASLSVDELQRELDVLELPPGAEVAVLDRQGITLSARPDGGKWAGRPFDPRLVQQLHDAGGPALLPGADGERRMFALRDVTAQDGAVAMRVVAGFPTGPLIAPGQSLSRRALYASLLATVLALGAAALVAELTLVRRLRRLAAVSRRIAAGDWSARTGLPGGKDELGQLVGSFDEMAQSLETLDREKRLREEQLHHAQKMEVVGRLAGGVAHDFNNLLTVILSAAAEIREQLPPDHACQQDAQEVIESGRRAAALTRRLLAFARQQPLAPRVIDLGETAHGMEKMLRRVLGEDVTLSVEVRAEPRVRADPGQLELALLNLAVNARDAMPDGGHLEIRVDVIPAADPRRPPGDDVPAGPLASLSVRDDGTGMDDKVRARIFEPFFTTKSSGRGTGLGLSTVLAIVAQSGGAIRVDSAPGKGTEFRIYIPVSAAGADEDVRAPRPAPVGKGESILVVEDDAQVRAMARRILVSNGHRVVVASGSKHALELARSDEAPDLLVSDVILPDGNGVELARELGRRWPGIAVVFMSGYTGQNFPALDALPSDARFLPKPFTRDALLRAVHEALDRRAAGPVPAANA
jgi:signal transduction histidine kinase/ActR/RegA family two-component response regulator